MIAWQTFAQTWLAQMARRRNPLAQYSVLRRVSFGRSGANPLQRDPIRTNLQALMLRRSVPRILKRGQDGWNPQ